MELHPADEQLIAIMDEMLKVHREYLLKVYGLSEEDLKGTSDGSSEEALKSFDKSIRAEYVKYLESLEEKKDA